MLTKTCLSFCKTVFTPCVFSGNSLHWPYPLQERTRGLHCQDNCQCLTLLGYITSLSLFDSHVFSSIHLSQAFLLARTIQTHQPLRCYTYSPSLLPEPPHPSYARGKHFSRLEDISWNLCCWLQQDKSAAKQVRCRGAFPSGSLSSETAAQTRAFSEQTHFGISRLFRRLPLPTEKEAKPKSQYMQTVVQR